jgi:hypothetical protein
MAFKTWTGTDGMAPIQAPSAGKVRDAWSPTILYMLGLIVAEILIVGFLSRNLLR